VPSAVYRIVTVSPALAGEPGAAKIPGCAATITSCSGSGCKLSRCTVTWNCVSIGTSYGACTFTHGESYATAGVVFEAGGWWMPRVCDRGFTTSTIG